MSAQVSKPILGLVILALVLAGASLTQAFVLSGTLSEQTKKVEELSSELGTVSNRLGSQASTTEAQTGTRTIYMIAIADLGGNGYDKFLPETITVLKGDKVKIILNNTDEMDHGLAIDAYGISQTVKAHETVTIEFVADKAGVFEYYCTIPCGPGHTQMTGQLIVLG